MKKILAIILALATILSFSACSDNSGSNTQIENNNIDENVVNDIDNADDFVDDEAQKQNTSAIRASGTDQGVNWVFYEDGELVISGWAEMGNGNYYKASSYDWNDFRDYITKVTITEGVMNISPSAFEGCVNLESVYMADTVTAIGDYAFSGCEKLSVVRLSSNLTYIGDSFKRCTSIRDIKFPVGLENIGGFSSCSGLTSITIPSGVTRIGDAAFYNCSNLSTIYIPKTVEDIYINAFDNCTSLTDIYYEGDETAWSEVDYSGYHSNGFESMGDDFLPDTITVHYNSTMP